MLNFALSAQTNPWPSYIMMGLMLVAMYLILFLPQKKQQKKDAAMRNSLDIGDEVITQGGILGRIVTIKDNSIVIETTGDRTKIRILKNAIVANNTPKEAPVPVEAKSKKAEKAEKAAEKAAEKEAEKAEKENAAVEAAPETDTEGK